MTAISKAWVTLTDAATDADSPVDQALVQGIRDDLVHLREWLGASFFAGAAQDHNHDGSNSALVEIGPNLLRNGSFESDGAGWTITTYTGGSQAINTAQEMDGAKCLALTSTSTVNGGGQAINGQFINVTGGEAIELDLAIKASVVNISSRVEAIWYDDAQAQISASTLYDVTNTPTTNTVLQRGAVSPSNARFCKVRVTGGVPGAGSATGTVYFDGLRLRNAAPAVAGNYSVSLTISGSSTSNTPTKYAEFVAPKSGVFTTVMTLTNAAGGVARCRVYKNGVAFGTDRSTSSASPVSYSENLSFNKGDLIQGYLWNNTPGEQTNSTFRLTEGSPSGLYSGSN